MQRYYRTVMELSRLNEMLLQLFEEAILMDPNATPEPLNERFQIKNGYLQTVNERVFRNDPSALLELFLVLQQNPEIRGVSAYTIGLIKRNLHLIDDEFRQNPRNHRLFLEILRAPEGVTHELRRMNLYGVLGLLHSVLRPHRRPHAVRSCFMPIPSTNTRCSSSAICADSHCRDSTTNSRTAAQIMQSLEQPEIAYLGGLFHDIAKGRGGDHSELGAVDAEAFCLEHGLSKYDAGMVAWLVRNHLILSITAQKKDIGDPDGHQ